MMQPWPKFEYLHRIQQKRAEYGGEISSWTGMLRKARGIGCSAAHNDKREGISNCKERAGRNFTKSGKYTHFYHEFGDNLLHLCDEIGLDLTNSLMQDGYGLPRGPWPSDDAALAEIRISRPSLPSFAIGRSFCEAGFNGGCRRRAS